MISFSSQVKMATHTDAAALSLRKMAKKLGSKLKEVAEVLLGLRVLHLATTTPDCSAASQLVRRRRKRCERKHKRGTRGGIWARLAPSPHRAAVPSLCLANVCSIDIKMDHIELLFSSLRMFSWLSDNVLDSAIQLARLTCYHPDRVLAWECVFTSATPGAGMLLLCVNTVFCWRSLSLSANPSTYQSSSYLF